MFSEITGLEDEDQKVDRANVRCRLKPTPELITKPEGFRFTKSRLIHQMAEIERLKPRRRLEADA